MTISQYAFEMAARAETFVRDIVIPYEQDPRQDHHHVPLDELVYEMGAKAQSAGVLTSRQCLDSGHPHGHWPSDGSRARRGARSA